MMTHLIHCTESDSMSEKDFRASIELLGLIPQKDTKVYYISFKDGREFNFYSEPIKIKPLRITYKNFKYPLGSYKRLLYKVIRDIKQIKNIGFI